MKIRASWVETLLACLFLVLQAEAEPFTWATEAGHRSAPLNAPESNEPGFFIVPPESSGVTTANTLTEVEAVRNRNLLGGSGVAAGDADGDGWCDLFFCRLKAGNVLFRNRGDWTFEDATESSGLPNDSAHSTGAAFADLDGDGDLDLLTTSLGGGLRLFFNDGHGRFSETTRTSGVASKKGSMSITLADVEGDGDLDIYVANYRVTTIKDQPKVDYQIRQIDGRNIVTAVNGVPATHPSLTNRFELLANGQVQEFGEVDDLFINDGGGTFKRLAFTGGNFSDAGGRPIERPPRGWGLAAMFYDVNRDGLPDLYVCNDYATPDDFWINQGGLKFRSASPLEIRTTSLFSMGVDFADVDRDEDVDFLVVDMLSPDPRMRKTQVTGRSSVFWPVGEFKDTRQYLRNTLQLNRGNDTFAEVARYAGLDASDWSWGCVFLDVDLDGYEDALIPNGTMFDLQNGDFDKDLEQLKLNDAVPTEVVAEMAGKYPRLKTPNKAFRNLGNLKFSDAGEEWGFHAAEIAQGMAAADLDNDGDLDVIANNLNAPPTLYRNQTAKSRIAVRLKGVGKNTFGVGARIEFQVNPNAPVQSQEIIAGGRYLSGDQPLRVFAAQNASDQARLKVVWNDGAVSLLEGVRANRIYEIHQSASASPSSSPANQAPNPQAPLFQDVSDRLNHSHAETVFDDFIRQPLLPYRWSQQGPGVSWFDIDGDGFDDLILGSGRGGSLGLYMNQQGDSFRRVAYGAMTRPAALDQMSVLGWLPQSRLAALIVGQSHYEAPFSESVPATIHYFDKSRDPRPLREQRPAAGSMAMADVDLDGDLDLFVGGQLIQYRYPESASSFIYINENGEFILHQRLERIGVVTGACFSDLDRDGTPELILARDWDSLQVWAWTKDQFQDRTREWGLAGHKGWWKGVTTGDVNGDGTMDIVAANYGLNADYQASPENPHRVYYRDFLGKGAIDLIEARFEEEIEKEAPYRHLNVLRAALPGIGRRIKSYKQFSDAGVKELLDLESLEGLNSKSATTFASTVFLNVEGAFEAVPLPSEAQFAPAFGVNSADLDGDGHEDLFLSQNLFAMQPDGSRHDAGVGLVLIGRGDGTFRSLTPLESGVQIYGEQRGSSLSDMDRDGRIDLCVGQNASEVKLYRNIGAEPGLRIRLLGTENNPLGVGAWARLWFSKEERGVWHEIKSGSGWLSQESASLVLAAPKPPAQVEVRWPGGNVTKGEIPNGASEIMINTKGQTQKTL